MINKFYNLPFSLLEWENENQIKEKLEQEKTVQRIKLKNDREEIRYLQSKIRQLYYK